MPHAFVDCMGIHRTDSYTRYIQKLRDHFHSPFVQFYLYCIVKVALLCGYRCVCRIRLTEKFLAFSTSRSLFDDKSQPLLLVVFVSIDDNHVLEKVDINNYKECDIKKIPLSESTDLELLFYNLYLINKDFFTNFYINADDSFDVIINKLRNKYKETKPKTSRWL